MAPPADCGKASRIAPAKACVATPHGVVLAPDKAEAERLAELAREGETRMLRHFGRSPALYAIVQDIAPGDMKALGAAGYRSVLPWLTAAQMEDGVVASIRRGAEAQAKAQGASAEQTAQATDAAIARWRRMNAPAAKAKQDAGIVPHEAGHGWYIAAFWPGTRVEGQGHYGGPGPDWMDETAAVLMEGDGFAQDRRKQFETVYRGTGKGPVMGTLSATELVDLPLFLRRDHPAKNLLQRAAAKPVAGSSGVRVLAGAEAVSAAGGAILFYLQSRMFADYLIARTGKPAIFGEIGAAFGRGSTIEQWLGASGRSHGLPTTVAALDADWRAWLSGRYGALVVKPVPAVTAPTS